MQSVSLRHAGPNETRCIVRHSLGYYSHIVVACVYLVPQVLLKESDLTRSDIYVAPLQECVHQHPFLSTTIQDPESNKPIYTRPTQIDLKDHIRITSIDDFNPQNETALLGSVLMHLHNDVEFKLSSLTSRPAWKLIVLPLSSEDSTCYRVLIAFSYSHSHGDGISGTIFHQTFFEAFRKSLQAQRYERSTTIDTPPLSLPDQPDTALLMPISIPYLLRPALATYLPTFLTRLFGLSGSLTGADDKTWTGATVFADNNTPGLKVTTAIEILRIEPQILSRMLASCRKSNTKLTPLLNQLIAQAVYTTLSMPNHDTTSHTNFVSQIPVNLRKVLGATGATIGNYGGVAFQRHEFDGLNVSMNEDLWRTFRSQGEHLSQVASNARNQPVGLLRFVSNTSSWLHGQLGQSRDSSWELSNLGNFSPDDPTRLADNNNPTTLQIEQIMFSQPASPMSPPLTFNAVAVRGGRLNICISWQPGALNLRQPSDSITSRDQVADEERKFVQEIVAKLTSSCENIDDLAPGQRLT